MASLNKIIIIGNLGRDPEMRYTPSGSPVTNFTVAVSRRYNTRDGEPREETEWFRVACWDKLAETANQYLQKGKQVYVEGRVRVHTWDDSQSGEKRAQMEITASNLVLLGSRDDAGGAAQGAGADPAALDDMPF